MEQHGANPRQNVIAIIPARFQSTRLEGKLLLLLGGKPLILHTLERAQAARNISRVIVATDDERILNVVLENGGEAVLTSPEHQSGSDRIAEVAENLPENSIIVNVQGDEPLIPAATIEKAVEAILADETADIATTSEKFSSAKDILDPNNVKIVCDANDFALYFSRSPMPFPRDAVNKYGGFENALRSEPELFSLYRKHTGLYVYRREFLLKFTKTAQSILEKTEMLEQLRALENGAKIKVIEVSESSTGVDTREDFERVKALFGKGEKSANDFSFRRAKVDDVSQIARVYVTTSQNSCRGIVPQDYLDGFSVARHQAELWKSIFTNGFQIFVVENADGKTVGFAEVAEIQKNIGLDHKLVGFYVLPEYQRKGVGSRLFDFAVEQLSLAGVKSLILEALESSPFKSFYDKKGGEKIGFSHIKINGEEFKTLVYGWKDLGKL